MMKINSVEIHGLHGHDRVIELNFKDDLNIITGRNGAGKTTIFKLIWYILSGNISLALNEIKFANIKIKTNLYECTVFRFDYNTCEVHWLNNDSKEKQVFKDIIHEKMIDEHGDIVDGFFKNAQDIPDKKLRESGSSLFFPTFRRIEGGFSISSDEERLLRRLKGSSVTDSLETVLSDLSKKLTNSNHHFIASVSTKDIENLLIRKFSELSEEVNNIQQEISNDAISKIKSARNINNKNTDAQNLLDEVQKKFENLEEIRASKMKPFDTLKDLVTHFLNHSGVQLGNIKSRSINIGDTADAISSDLLSAGEKQMLSFLAYNIFYQDTIFIIDEPEISLHVDWQRQLLPTLMKQGTSNQFIVATHSPFIYSKYPDKELQLDSDRGNNV